MYNKADYQLNYQNLTFENHLRSFRMYYIVKYLKSINANKILEIGCGNDPIFEIYKDFQVMDVIEPGDYFYEDTKSKIGNNTKISITKGYIEDVYEDFKKEYDVIVIGGFLHEIDNPEAILAAIKNIVKPHTIVITYVPNANSFHRLLAVESGIIATNYEFSENDKLFGRRNVFNSASLSSLFVNSGFFVTKTETYFIKPFTHEQMDSLLKSPFFSEEILLGLYKMAKYMPDLGCELFLAATGIF